MVLGTGTYNTAESQELTGSAARVGADACLLVVPYYNRPPQEGLYQHFRTVAEATELPCILYNVPSRTGTNMSPETVVRLASEVPNIVGLKEASGSLNQVSKIIEGVKRDFFLWSGNDSDTLAIMALGGYGVISVASHLVGRQLRKMIGEILDERRDQAVAVHDRLLPLFSALFVVSNPIPVKYALNRVGFPVGEPRLPLVPPDEKTARLIDEELAKQQIDLLVKK